MVEVTIQHKNGGEIIDSAQFTRIEQIGDTVRVWYDNPSTSSDYVDYDGAEITDVR